jgi:hypothetical protein
MPVTKSESIERMSIWGIPLRSARGRTVAKWTAVAICALLCAEIGAVAARGRYSNFGPWPSSHSQASEISATPRPNERPRRGFALGTSNKDLREREATRERHRHNHLRAARQAYGISPSGYVQHSLSAHDRILPLLVCGKPAMDFAEWAKLSDPF